MVDTIASGQMIKFLTRGGQCFLMKIKKYYSGNGRTGATI
jgi:hypothetical protein